MTDGAAALLDGKLLKLGRIHLQLGSLGTFPRTVLANGDHVVLATTANAAMPLKCLRTFKPHGHPHPEQVRLIAHIKIKAGAIDSAMLAKLYATGFLPEVGVPD